MRYPKRATALKCETAREFRRQSTIAEQAVWRMVRNRQLLGLKFRRQHVIDGFIVDFYCPALRLILEVDGTVHDGPVQRSVDEARTDRFVNKGLRIVRIRNEAVDRPAIVSAIEAVVSPSELGPAQQSNPSPCNEAGQA